VDETKEVHKIAQETNAFADRGARFFFSFGNYGQSIFSFSGSTTAWFFWGSLFCVLLLFNNSKCYHGM
jgi:hypothetical protein